MATDCIPQVTFEFYDPLKAVVARFDQSHASTAGGVVLLQELRRCAQGTTCATAQVVTLRERLLKLAVWVERSVRRLVLHLPQFAPWSNAWCRVAVAVGATPG